MTAAAFVGRLRELEQLQKFRSEAAGGRAVTAFLAGEAGVGKSRLLSEFAERARTGGAHVLRGACIELGGGVIPYAPLVESLRLLVREHGEDRVRELAGPSWAVLAGLISDFTGSATSVRPGDGSGGWLHVFGAVLRLLDHLGRDAPVVLIFEDVHWADQSTLDLISYLARAKSTERALLLCSYRTQLPPGHPLRLLLAEPDFRRRVAVLELPPFTEAELSRFLADLGPVDLDVVRRGYRLSDGNAFFAEQLMVSGALTEPGSGRIPTSISELMLARIRTLGPDARRVMRVAATAARRVDDRLLAAVCRLGDDALEQALHECLDEGLLAAGSVGDSYVVQHALLREAVYEDMLQRERRRLHTEMAEAITADAALSLADELGAAVELAHHWYCAQRWPQALAAAVNAGAVTNLKRAFHEAEAQYKRALELWEAVPEAERPAGVTREGVLVAVADAARWTGHVEQAVGHVLEALDEVDQQAAPRRAGELYERLGSYRWEAGATAEARQAYLAAQRLLAAAGTQDAVHARVVAALATDAVQSGAYSAGLRQARQAIDLAGAAGAPAAKGRALNTAGVALTMLGKPHEGVPLLEEALRIAKQTDHLEDLFRAYGNLEVAFEHTGDLGRAADVALEGLDHARRLGLIGARQTSVLANNAGYALMLGGRWDDAEQLLDEVLAHHPLVAQSLYLRLTLAEIDVARGRFGKAARLLGEVRDSRISDPWFTSALHACEAELAGWRGEPARALDAVEHGLARIGDTENAVARLRLYAAGLRALADGHEAPDERGVHFYPDAVEAAAGDASSREEQVLLWQCAQERARTLDADTAEGWARVASAWDALGRPYPAAYARWRQAAASLRAGDAADAQQAAQAAYSAAQTLRAAPLRAEVEKLPVVLDAAPSPAVPAGAAASGSAAPGTGTVDAAAANESVKQDLRGLTPRELEIFGLVCEGLGNREIGNHFHLAEGTIATHMNRIMAKLGVKSRAEAIVFAYKTHFFEALGAPAAPSPDH